MTPARATSTEMRHFVDLGLTLFLTGLQGVEGYWAAGVSTSRDVLITKIVDWGVPLNHCIKLQQLSRYLRAQIEPRPRRYGAAGFALPALGLSDVMASW